MQKRINLFDLHANLRANKCMEHCEGCGETVLLLIYWYFPLIAGQLAVPVFGLPPICADTF